MLDLTGLPALDLAIGLAFIFFLLATLAATIQEFIAAIFGLRARMLEEGLRSMLEDPEHGWSYVDKFYDHPLIQSLYRTPGPGIAGPGAGEETRGRNWASVRTPRKPRRVKGPSYVSPRAFALALLDTVAPVKDQAKLFEELDRFSGEAPAGLGKRLKPLVDHAERDVTKLRTNAEAWFDDTMARVSGWYKRKT